MFKNEDTKFGNEKFEDSFSEDEEVENIYIGEDGIKEKKITLTKRT